MLRHWRNWKELKLTMKLLKRLILFGLGGITYFIIEILWRGYSHLSMFILGGVCFVLIGLINEYYSWELPLWNQMLFATIIITTLEFIFGVILNILLGLSIWDYSNLRFNVLGQISLGYSALWFLLSLPAIVLDDWLRYWLFNEEKPRYKII